MRCASHKILYLAWTIWKCALKVVVIFACNRRSVRCTNVSMQNQKLSHNVFFPAPYRWLRQIRDLDKVACGFADGTALLLQKDLARSPLQPAPAPLLIQPGEDNPAAVTALYFSKGQGGSGVPQASICRCCLFGLIFSNRSLCLRAVEGRQLVVGETLRCRGFAM